MQWRRRSPLLDRPAWHTGAVFGVVCGLAAVLDGFPLWGIALFAGFKFGEGVALVWLFRRWRVRDQQRAVIDAGVDA